ncbi:hypothetical protein DAEQUDRAFT_471271 [Daedalea quercina L-15889]|uniref:Uncharacterized protein n=1 Tax=Daedalea quercina L-15889 TaxID=1314783 RepID=A0A165MYM5_9APHY|nr:hypothetical protein DAEQUDRAFT_471271 [Daedalea quercina L-15889]
MIVMIPLMLLLYCTLIVCIGLDLSLLSTKPCSYVYPADVAMLHTRRPRARRSVAIVHYH